MVLVFQVLLDEVGEQLLQHVGGVLQLALQTRHDERGHVAAIAHGEAALQLQRSDEGQQEDFVVDQLSKELQGLLHALLPVPLDLWWRRGCPSVKAREEKGPVGSPAPPRGHSAITRVGVNGLTLGARASTPPLKASASPNMVSGQS